MNIDKENVFQRTAFAYGLLDPESQTCLSLQADLALLLERECG